MSVAARAVGIIALLLVLVLTTTVAVFGRSRAAGADPVSDLQAKAAQISRALLQEQLQLAGDQQQYEVVSATVQTDTQAIAQTQSSITRDQDRIKADRTQLRSEAVWAYIHGDRTLSGAAGLFDTNAAAAGAQSEYARVIGGDLATTLAHLHTDQNSLQSSQLVLRQREAADQASRDHQAALVGETQSTERSLQSQQAEVTGQLAAAVAQQKAVEAQQAAAAIAAAQAQAATQAQAVSQQSSGGGGAPVPPPSSGGSDPALPPFLQCVVQYESGGDYGAVSPNGLYRGAFQFSQPTWNEAAQLAGRPDLIGVLPNLASKADQDTLAVALYAADGSQPWLDPCTGH